MHTIYVDDERSSHINFIHDMNSRPPLDSLHCFLKGEDALAYAQAHPVDCAFLDIELGGGDTGIELATKLQAIHPNIEVVFVTAYDVYARAAFRVGGRTFLSKPYSQEELDDSLSLMRKLVSLHHAEAAPKEPNIVHIKTFGNFDVLINGRPMLFKTGKAKEMLALLVDQCGGTVSNAQIFDALWEGTEYTNVTSTYVRRTSRSLKMELEAAGIRDLLVARRSCYGVGTARCTCDYYAALAGDADAVRSYRGAYMSQYSWGEYTIPVLERKLEALGYVPMPFGQ